jgi:hypothetical protein
VAARVLGDDDLAVRLEGSVEESVDADEPLGLDIPRKRGSKDS